MTKDEALKLALKFVEDSECGTADLEAHIKEALEQPEQEPQIAINSEIVSYVAPQREWVGLTRDEQSFVYDTLKNSTSRKDSFWVDFANAIGQALKEKNT